MGFFWLILAGGFLAMAIYHLLKDRSFINKHEEEMRAFDRRMIAAAQKEAAHKLFLQMEHKKKKKRKAEEPQVISQSEVPVVSTEVPPEKLRERTRLQERKKVDKR